MKTKSRPSFNTDAFRKAPYHEQVILDSLLRFESRMASVEHSVCAACFECSIDMSLRESDSVCYRCCRSDDKGSCTEGNVMLPTWDDDEGTLQYHVPEELSGLTIAEVLIIQRVSPLVPLVHIRNGTLGIKGHVCSFVQDINGVATKLPRLPKDVTAVKVVRSYKGSDGIDAVKTYTIRREKVMRALYWLVKHHKDYKSAFESGELTLDETNLGWMKGAQEAELPTAELVREFDTREEANGEQVVGVSKQQCGDPDEFNDELESSGITSPTKVSLTSVAQDAIIRSLKDAASDNTNLTSLDWPQQSSVPISEYDDSIKIFVNAFPHLFPGGTCDVNERDRHTDVKVSKWVKHLLLYRDGRFARDPIWPFFAYNYTIRKRNRDSGAYFINSIISNPPKSLEELQDSLRNGDTSFVSKIMYYQRRISGSDEYWRYKRAELYNWINYHIAEGHGAPNGFFTLSCAEYFWPDMIRLLEDRIWIAEGRQRNGPGAKVDRNGHVIDLANDRKARNKAVNDYSIVVQQFFIKRTEDFLNTVGKKILGIEHYWLRFEFAKGRGQIHAHILVILRKEIQVNLQNQVNSAKGNRQKEANLIADWARQQFGMTAKHEAKSTESEKRYVLSLVQIDIQISSRHQKFTVGQTDTCMSSQYQVE